nr:hypothetical protein HmN_000897500 [Hymenolepis microstoma]
MSVNAEGLVNKVAVVENRIGVIRDTVVGELSCLLYCISNRPYTDELCLESVTDVTTDAICTTLITNNYPETRMLVCAMGYTSRRAAGKVLQGRAYSKKPNRYDPNTRVLDMWFND